MNISHLKKTCTGFVAGGCATLFVVAVISFSPVHINEAQALSVAYPGGHHYKHHKHRYKNHKYRHRYHHRYHRNYYRGHRHRFHFGFHGSRYYGPRYYGRSYYNAPYYGGGYPVAHPVPVPVPVAPPVICPIPTAPPVAVTPGYPSYGGGAVGPVYQVFVPGGC